MLPEFHDDSPESGASPAGPGNGALAQPHELAGSGPLLQDPLELRLAPRVAYEAPVDLYTTDFAGPLPARARDLSIQGACIASASPFAVKSIQRVVISLPSGSLSLDAEGRWQRDLDSDDVMLTGVSFIDPSNEAADQLWDLVFSAGRKLARFLFESPHLPELGVEEGLGLAQMSRFRNVPMGRTIYRQDTRNPGEDSIFVVLEGSIALQVRVRDAFETEVERVMPGQMFGGVPLIADVGHAESAVAATDARLLEIDRHAFRHLRTAKPWLGYRVGQTLMRVSALRLRHLYARMANELR